MIFQVPVFSCRGGAPNHWNLLSDADKAAYQSLRISFNATCFSGGKTIKFESFEDSLHKIRNFAERGDGNDWRRFLVCGICWLEEAVATNTKQLCHLISKCKSSINGSFVKLGYAPNISNNFKKEIVLKIPLLKDNFSEIRQWTFRIRNTTINQKPNTFNSFLPPINDIDNELNNDEVIKKKLILNHNDDLKLSADEFKTSLSKSIPKKPILSPFILPQLQINPSPSSSSLICPLKLHERMKSNSNESQ